MENAEFEKTLIASIIVFGPYIIQFVWIGDMMVPNRHEFTLTFDKAYVCGGTWMLYFMRFGVYFFMTEWYILESKKLWV